MAFSQFCWSGAVSKRFVLLLAICVFTTTAAHAQYGGGGGAGGGGGGRGGHGGGGRKSPTSPTPASGATSNPASPDKPLNTVQIIGEVKAIDPDNSRITIAYEPVDALNWPAGTMPFVVSKAELLNGITVGEKVRFHLESQQISTLAPF